MKQNTRIIPAAAALVLAANAVAQETTLPVSAGATHSDNIARVGANEESDTILEAGLQLGFRREGRLDTDVSVDLRYLSYLDETFDDELVGGLSGSFSFAFVPDRFMWVLDNDFGQSFIDPRDVETPDNRQNLNYFTTGPTVVLPLGSRTNLTISGRWSDVDYEESDLDNQRLMGQVQLAREMSDSSSLSLDLSSQRVEFDQSPPNSDYDLHTLALVYRASSARTTLAVSGGMTSLHDFGDSSDGPLLDVMVTREVGARSRLTLNVGTRFFDSAESFRRDRELLDIEIGNESAVPAGDAFQQEYASLGWELTGSRTSLRLAADWRDEDREVDSEFDRESRGLDTSVSRRVGSRTTASLFGRYVTEEFSNGGVDFDEWSAGVGLDWSLSGSVVVGLRAEHIEGSGDTSAGAGTRDYEENRYTLRFEYSPGR